MTMLFLALLLQAEEAGQADPGIPGVLRFFAGFALVLIFYCGVFLFTYWIGKDE